MSVATTRSAQTSFSRTPVLTPLYGAHHESFRALADGTYRCGSGAASEFSLGFSGAVAAHCCFTRQAGAFSVNCLDGRVWINDLPVSGVNQLTEGDVVSLGPVSYRLEFQEVPSLLPEPVVRPSISFAPPVQDTPLLQTSLQKELEEHQRLLTMRQQQLDDLTQIVRERERFAETRLAAIEDRSSQITAQWNELVLKLERFAAQEREIVLRSEEVDRQHKTLADQLRLLADAAEQNSQSIAAVEQAQHELSKHETELRQLQLSTEARQLALQEWQSEIESRANEVSARLLKLKTYRREQRASQAVAVEPATPVVDAEMLEGQAAAIRAEREELDCRTAETVAAEERLAATLRSVASIVQAAESERATLQGANEILVSERCALSQLRQDLASRESGVGEREVLVSRQLDDLRSRFAVLDLHAAELRHHESEIDSRAADVHRCVQQFKSDRHAHRESIRCEQPADGANFATIERDAELLSVRQQLDELLLSFTAADNERASMLSERESLLSDVRELQDALQDAGQDIDDANRLKSESVLHEQRLEQARQAVEEHRRYLQLSESKLLQVKELSESLRAELAKSVLERDELNAKLAEYSLPAVTVPPMHLAGGDTGNAESFEQHSRELDQRAELLDRRDEEIRERARKIEQSEGDLESQRRQLLEARQQLELARAEIQAATRQLTLPAEHAASSARDLHADSSAAGELEPYRQVSHDADLDYDRDHSVSTFSAHGPATDLPSVLPGLFGMRKSAARSVTPVPQAECLDLSEPTGTNKAVAFRFGSNVAQLMATASVPAVEPLHEPAREENSDDFVRNYMEQLLSRCRKSAGYALPGELTAADKKREPPAAPAAKPARETPVKSAPKVKSFIEQYLLANNVNLDDSEALKMSDPTGEFDAVAAVVEEQPIHPRQKMVLQKLKQNMDSFRTLSALSVQNALASHATRVERHRFTGRTAFAAVLITMTVLLGIANAWGVIDSPMLKWVTLTSAIAMISELYRRYSAIRIHTRYPLDLLFATDASNGPVLKSTNSTVVESPLVKDSASDDHITIIE